MTTASAVLRRRQLRATPLLSLAFAGVPALLIGYSLAVELSWGMAAPGGIMLVAGLLTAYWSRHRPGRWAQRGFYFGLTGAIPALTTYIVAVVEDVELPLGAVGGLALCVVPAIVCWGLGWLAHRVLTFPVVEELAESRYEWTLPLRGLRRVALTVGTADVGIAESQWAIVLFLHLDPVERRARVPLDEVDLVWDATTSGVAPASLPETVEATCDEITGAAVGIRGAGQTWVLPVDHAPQVVRLLQRRVATRVH